MKISYVVHDKVGVDEFIDILKRSGLALRRPVDSPKILEKMLVNASLIITVRDDSGKIVGIARSITDFAYCCYLSCLAVDKEYQRKNIGKRLIKKTLLDIFDVF